MPARDSKRTPWQYVLVAMLMLLAGIAMTGSVVFASRPLQLPGGASTGSHPDRPGSRPDETTDPYASQRLRRR